MGHAIGNPKVDALAAEYDKFYNEVDKLDLKEAEFRKIYSWRILCY